MPILKNQRHELFAQHVAKGRTADVAYKLAGFTANRGNACRLKADERILNRIAEIQAEMLSQMRSNAEVTIESLMREAEEQRQTAIAQGQIGAANGALKLKSIYAGLYVERSDHRISHDPVQLPDAQLLELAATAIEDKTDEPLPLPN